MLSSKALICYFHFILSCEQIVNYSWLTRVKTDETLLLICIKLLCFIIREKPHKGRG